MASRQAKPRGAATAMYTAVSVGDPGKKGMEGFMAVLPVFGLVTPAHPRGFGWPHKVRAPLLFMSCQDRSAYVHRVRRLFLNVAHGVSSHG
mmetsp:Transcript_16854/g.40123  ORF Transcript_16854/g.40123 Transcript_16854/m.40123 type:complete len:91 (+) Transcript_16854:1247-1519(+)